MYYGIINSMNRAVLSSYLNPDFAYSFRKVISTATLSCRVRRSSDNAEQNIGFVGNDLDTASLLSFVGANNGFITTIYEQKGTGGNLVQITAANQFQIVSSGTLVTNNGKSSCIAAGGKYMFTTTLFSPNVTTGASLFSVTKPISQIGSFSVDFSYSIGNGNNSTTGRFIESSILGPSGVPTTYVQFIQQGTSAIQTPYTSGTKLLSHLIKTGDNKYYQNNALIGSNSTTLNTPAAGQALVINSTSWSMGAITTNQYFSEILIYNSDQNTDLTTINTNINSYYSIY
jgi:hypothetical protein